MMLKFRDIMDLSSVQTRIVNSMDVLKVDFIPFEMALCFKKAEE